MYPTLFISHGAPNIILSDSKSKRNFQKLGKSLSTPKYIIIISAHYVTNDLRVISPDANKIMYDFYGFEDELYKVAYEINSDKNLTSNLIKTLKDENIDISIDESRISYDHGVWNVLALLYEKLNIPVIQLSIPYSYSPSQLINLGEKLKVFKDEAMIICSGGITHNLGDMSYNLTPKSYAKDFNEKIKTIIENSDENGLLNITSDINFRKNHPSSEHFLPLFIAFGSAINKKGKSVNSEMQYSNISMESFIFDETKKIPKDSKWY
jgi:4,5-DOPA dioxygenase extradiol